MKGFRLWFRVIVLCIINKNHDNCPSKTECVKFEVPDCWSWCQMYLSNHRRMTWSHCHFLRWSTSFPTKFWVNIWYKNFVSVILLCYCIGIWPNLEIITWSPIDIAIKFDPVPSNSIFFFCNFFSISEDLLSGPLARWDPIKIWNESKMIENLLFI